MDAQIQKLQNITDMISQYQKATTYNKVIKKLNNGVSFKIKRLNVMRGRLYYPAKRREPSATRKSPSQITILKNTAMNTFTSLDEATDEEIYKRMYMAKQREKLIKANTFISSIMSMAGGSYQKALQMHGLTNENNQFQYNEDEDDSDYEPSEDSEEDEEEEEGVEGEEEEGEEGIEGEEEEEEVEEDDEEFEEQENLDDDEEQEEDDDEEEGDFNVSFEE
ncbi:hypothetical protein DICPUDRAFT_152657 [Dictyostelium purpureum]|uniref:Uncharacterized protein n=1 Tax=Dictyostelium purpureum TaxID=5786 RepID=F0ZLY7_DICPU|nr:uncharacterized protein DICPUDRAFT_152657 [Dictyostelium purpureum]EGC35050.1 hypothetical protein DICPUDRAFT_152657 [Dictyostelium purpureum]|eukprot:XP_003288418.1 hypothetical protein DICPUDRAFT_152657 [Dictyostelium purpureum]